MYKLLVTKYHGLVHGCHTRLVTRDVGFEHIGSRYVWVANADDKARRRNFHQSVLCAVVVSIQRSVANPIVVACVQSAADVPSGVQLHNCPFAHAHSLCKSGSTLGYMRDIA